MGHSKRYENTLVAILFFTWGTVFLDRTSQLYLAPYIVPEFGIAVRTTHRLCANGDRSAIGRIPIRRIRHRKLLPIAS
jgi:hypothetical protein